MSELLETDIRPRIIPEQTRTCFALAPIHPPTETLKQLRRFPVTIGRDPACDVSLSDGSVSREHARIERSGRVHVVRDLGSTNGCYVNQTRVEDRSEIAAGDVVRLGDFVFFCVDWPLDAGLPEEVEASDSPMIGGLALSEVRQRIRLLGPTALRVLIRGESGTGKELVARELYRQTGSEGPFIAVNCAALPESLVEAELFGYVRGAFTGANADKPGLFEAAAGGTLFLDEVTELPLGSQAKLLRVVETGELRRVGAVRSTKTRCRILTATNRDMQREVDAQRFRADLAARLSEAEIALPPLRDRIEDLPLLIEHLARRAGKGLRFDADAMEQLACYSWPLNVRELDNLTRTLEALAQKQIVTAAMLPPHLTGGATGVRASDPSASREVSAARARPFSRTEEVVAALRRNGGNIRQTSVDLGVSRSLIYRCLDRAGVDPAKLRGKK